jgi:hypothetical protein
MTVASIWAQLVHITGGRASTGGLLPFRQVEEDRSRALIHAEHSW